MIPLFSNDKTKIIDQLAAQALDVDSYALMQLAGKAVFEHVADQQRLLVICGPGNNGGDGFVVAELARKQGRQVSVLASQPLERLTGDAARAASEYQGVVLDSWPEESFDVVIDALFGTGLTREVSGRYAALIEQINQSGLPVLAIDIPSGLHGSTGQIMGCAVRASETVAILGRNTGLFTLDGPECCGQVHFASLGVPPEALKEVNMTAQLMEEQALKQLPAGRPVNAHKGSFGHVLTAGGQAGMLGAVLLAGRAVLKAGAGLTTLITDQKHAELIPLHAPELMVRGFAGVSDDETIQAGRVADVLLLGMGMGQSQWSKQLFKQALHTGLPLVLDADGLHLLARSPRLPEQLAVITPHPKEAAAMLKQTVQQVQQDRWQSVIQLARRYQCVAVLKGAGTLVSDGEFTWCCPFGNANLSTAGSGDVLAGMVAGILAQGYTPLDAAHLAVLWHALAGQRSRYGLTLTASELMDELHEIIH